MYSRSPRYHDKYGTFDNDDRKCSVELTRRKIISKKDFKEIVKLVNELKTHLTGIIQETITEENIEFKGNIEISFPIKITESTPRYYSYHRRHVMSYIASNNQAKIEIMAFILLVKKVLQDKIRLQWTEGRAYEWADAQNFVEDKLGYEIEPWGY